MQNGEGIRVSTTAVAGGSIIVNVGPTDDTVEVGLAGTNQSKSYDVPGNKDVNLPVPSVPEGSTLVVVVGKGLRRRRILVTIVAPTP